jgi:hypothetical protein
VVVELLPQRLSMMSPLPLAVGARQGEEVVERLQRPSKWPLPLVGDAPQPREAEEDGLQQLKWLRRPK